MSWGMLLFGSVTWVCFRLYQLIQIPRDVLEDRLGYDVPPAPEFSIADITDTSFLLHWLNAREGNFHSVTLSIYVNGIYLGSFGRNDTSIEVLQLRHNSSYSIKVVATNSSNISTASSPIRLQTLALNPESAKVTSTSGEDCKTALLRTSSSHSPNDSLRSHFSREMPHNHNSHSDMKHIPASQPVKEISDSGLQGVPLKNSTEASKLTVSLNARLDSLKSQKEDIERQIREEELESQTQLNSLSQAREIHRQELKEKEESSADLRRQGNHLEKLNRAAQNRRMTKEKQLQDAFAQRQKMHDNTQKWISGKQAMLEDVREMEREISKVDQANEKKIFQLRAGLRQGQEEVKQLEDEVRVAGTENKGLERKKERNSHKSQGKDEAFDQSQTSNESWEGRVQVMQAQLQSMWQALQQSKLEEQHAEEHFMWWSEKKARSPESFAHISFFETFQVADGDGSHKRSTTATSFGPAFSSLLAEPTNVKSGILTELHISNSQSHETTNGSTNLTTPANDLIPSNLLKDEDSFYLYNNHPSNQPAIGQADRTGLSMDHMGFHEDPATRSPASIRSRRGSLFSSPRGSVQNLHITSSETNGGAMSPIRLDASVEMPSAISHEHGGRFAHLFSSPFGRPRTKLADQDAPILGSLKHGQSQSIPRNFEQEASDSFSLRRRKGYNAHWSNPVAGFLGRSSSSRENEGRSTGTHPLRPEIETIDTEPVPEFQARSSRPSSTYSYEHIPRGLSTDMTGTWSTIAEQVPHHDVSSVPKWSRAYSPWHTQTGSRTSLPQHSTGNLSLGSHPIDSIDGSRDVASKRTEQAPIGTRPQSQRNTVAKLNPAAPTFKTIFNRAEGKKLTKTERPRSKGYDHGSSRDQLSMLTTEGFAPDELSPGKPRLSKDANSISTAVSTTDSYDSQDKSISNMDMSPQKESLMQKITRKSSSSKFNVPWPKDRARFSKKGGEASGPSENGDDNNTDGKGGETPREDKAARAWPSMRRKSRKGIQVAERETDSVDEDSQA